MIQSLRSISITETSTLLRANPSLCSASVLSPRGISTCASPLASERQVLMFHIKACFEFMPPTCRLPLCLLFQFTSKLIPGLRSELGFDSIGVHFDTSSGVHLRSSPQSIPDNSKIAFSLSLTTIALYKCRIGWFGSNFWWPKPRGLLSSLI